MRCPQGNALEKRLNGNVKLAVIEHLMILARRGASRLIRAKEAGEAGCLARW
jgi:hypothetical protein